MKLVILFFYSVNVLDKNLVYSKDLVQNVTTNLNYTPKPKFIDVVNKKSARLEVMSLNDGSGRYVRPADRLPIRQPPQVYRNYGRQYNTNNVYYPLGPVNPDDRQLPPDGTDNSQPYVITEDTLRQIRSEMMYWYFDQGGDNNHGDLQREINPSSTQIHKNFNFQLPFFGFRYNYTRVSLNGYLEFSDPPEQMTYPMSFPMQDWPQKNDPAFIGIFYSKCRIGSIRSNEKDQRQPGVYFRRERDLYKRQDEFAVKMRERLMWDIREGVVGADTFIPKHAVIVTWKNISFAGGIDASLTKTNTFQLVLATDEVFTYAIFNYLDIQWTSHTEAGGDTTGGEGGTPAFVGFNAGNGTRSYEYKPYSQMSTIRDLTGRGWANGFPGRHIFRIDENIIPGTCNKDIAGSTLKLSFAPESGNMLGGQVVNITGPCFTPDMRILCRFDVETVVGTVVDTNRAICVQPFVMADGYVIFDIAINNGKYNWKGEYFIESPATATERISFTNDAVHEPHPAEIKITWNKYNLTTNLAAPVQISLWGYRETTISPQLLYIDLIEAGVANTGSYVISPANYRLRNNLQLSDLVFGFLQINLTNPTQYQGLTVSPVLWSRPIPLGWYFAPQWERIYGKNWPKRMCDDWIMNDRYLKNFANELSMCPCTLEQALADKGRFLPDPDCDIDTNPNCYYNKGSRHCVRTGAPNLEGAEQQCCYDKNNFLMLSYDQMWGSSPKRSNNYGFLPWNEANKVPTLSQWFHDVSPFYLCCKWQEEQAIGCETLRFERRPSQDCVGYQSPYVATVFGDPHFVTFDDLEYTFNGKGEYVLVHTDSKKRKLDIQARYEQIGNNIYGEVMATKLTSIAARDNSSYVIEVRLRPKEAQWRYRLDVFADGKRRYFDRPSLRVQHFKGVTVYQPLAIIDQSQIIIMFQSGVGVEVLEKKGFMAARIYLPWEYINQTRGLLGNWSFDATDDFTLPNGQIVNVGSLQDFERLHKEFAINWLLEDKADKMIGDPLFVREYGRTASYYANRTFAPIWRKTPQDIIPPNRTKDIQTAESLCSDCYQCKYDYSVSLDKEMARTTLNFYSSYSKIKLLNKRRVLSCGVLETPRYGRKSNFFFTPDSKITFECNQGFTLVGDKRRICSAKGRWLEGEYGYTECLRYVEYDIKQLASTLLVLGAILLPLIIILVCIGAFYYRKHKRNTPNNSWKYQPHNDVPPTASTSLLQQKTTPPLETDKVDEHPVTSQALPQKTRTPFIYDRTYDTHEPLPGRPDIDFEDKDWDLPANEDSPVFATTPSKQAKSKDSRRNNSVETDIF
ncbi:sushi domain containing 2 mesh isoform X2 [Rhodnius prolixus]|uniref:sushi domain containing 2 mesh isoform X2 n=1 Tax=Rhodnius prolixus TaxID=13249 RepID=UPI003D18C17D